MRAISPHGRYSIPLTRGKVIRGVDSTGTLQEYEEGETTIANFEPGGLTDEESALVLAKFNFSGIPEGVNPLSTVGVYDTEAYARTQGWSDEYHEFVANRLRELSEANPNQFLVIEASRAPMPWPTYEDFEPEGVIAFAEAAGLLEQTLAYEVENLNRPEITGEIKLKLSDAPAAEEAIVVAA